MGFHHASNARITSAFRLALPSKVEGFEILNLRRVLTQNHQVIISTKSYGGARCYSVFGCLIKRTLVRISFTTSSPFLRSGRDPQEFQDPRPYCSYAWGVSVPAVSLAKCWCSFMCASTCGNVGKSEA